MKPSELNILVVEDDDFQRGMLVKMLSFFGILSIADVGDGKQALEKIRGENAKPVDIVICDLNMPQMDGLEFLRHLGQEKHNIAIIIVSGLSSKLLSSAGMMAEMYGIKLLGAIEKPISAAQLKTLLSTFERTENVLSQTIATTSFTLEEILQGIKNKQFEPYFQPKVDFKSGQLVGAETLARWIHPELGVILPLAFIPQLEQSKNIDDLTFLMLEKTAAVSRLFKDKNRPLVFSVNLSLASLDDTALADKITQIVRNAGIETKSIILEITESAAMTEAAQSLENLARLCMNGFQLSIDDYGTGYSSLQQLTRVAFSELKIDQSFVKDVAVNKSSRIVIESSIDMAHKLQVKSVAEGVETQRDWDALKSVGCDIAQGYFISKPLSMRDFYNFAGRYKYNSADITPTFFQNQSKLKILIVDDDDFSRKLVFNMLGFLGYASITDTDNARSALKLLESNSFDLIISDVYMPEMSGLEFIQMIRAGKTRAKPETRVMILSAFSKAEVIKPAVALNVNGFLVKPITPADMDEKIEKAMSVRFNLQPPATYEGVKIELNSVTEAVINKTPPTTNAEVASTLKDIKASSNEDENVSHLPVQRISPGMTLKRDVTLEDGTLLLSVGHVFTKLSVRRINDLRDLLVENDIAVQEIPRDLLADNDVAAQEPPKAS